MDGLTVSRRLSHRIGRGVASSGGYNVFWLTNLGHALGTSVMRVGGAVYRQPQNESRIVILRGTACGTLMGEKEGDLMERSGKVACTGVEPLPLWQVLPVGIEDCRGVVVFHAFRKWDTAVADTVLCRGKMEDVI